MEKGIPKTALVTGSGKRLGRAIVEDLARHGFAVAIHVNGSIDEAEALADGLRRDGARVAVLAADFRDIAQTAALMGAANAALGPIGLLVNNASVFLDDGADTFDPESFSAHFDLHVRAPSILGAAFFRQVPDDAKGLIVNIVDQRVLAPAPSFYSYTLSKSALLAATRTMAQAFAPKVRVNGIGPGPTFRSTRQEESDFQAQLDALPLGHGPELAEFGRTIRFLFDTPSITGQMIAVDGGQHLAWQRPGTEIVE